MIIYCDISYCKSDCVLCLLVRTENLLDADFVKTFDNRNVLIGQRFSVQQDVYEQHIRSSALNEYKVSHLSNMQAWDINDDVLYKTVKIPETFLYGNSFTVFPFIR